MAGAAPQSDQATNAARTTRTVVCRLVTLELNPDALGLRVELEGVLSEFASQDIMTAKRLVCLALQKAVQVCLSTEDQYGLQNAVIYFWNLHLSLFRSKLYGFVTDEVEAFLKMS